MTAPAVQVVDPRDSLAGALLRAQRAIAGVHKASKNDFHKYAYASSEDMITACRDVLHAEGIAVRRSGWTLREGSETTWTEVDKKTGEERGGTERSLTLVSTFVVAYPPTGEREESTVDFPIVPEKGRPYDKAAAGSLTVSLSYFLRDLLLVPRDDEEMDKRDDRGHNPRAAKSDLPTPQRRSDRKEERKEPPDLAPALRASIEAARKGAAPVAVAHPPAQPSFTAEMVSADGAAPPPFDPETGEILTEEPRVNKKDMARIFAAARDGNHPESATKAWLYRTYNVQHSSELPASKVHEVVMRLADPTELPGGES
jgi:hypothetical protein